MSKNAADNATKSQDFEKSEQENSVINITNSAFADESSIHQQEMEEAVAGRYENHHCNVCDVTCNSISALETHINGKKHQRKEKQLKSGPGFPSPEHEEIVLEVEALIQHRLYELAQTEPLIGLESVVERRYSGATEFSYFCGLCEMKALSLNMLEHLTGQKHRLAYLKKHHFKMFFEICEDKQMKGRELSRILRIRAGFIAGQFGGPKNIPKIKVVQVKEPTQENVAKSEKNVVERDSEIKSQQRNPDQSPSASVVEDTFIRGLLIEEFREFPQDFHVILRMSPANRKLLYSLNVEKKKFQQSLLRLYGLTGTNVMMPREESMKVNLESALNKLSLDIVALLSKQRKLNETNISDEVISNRFAEGGEYSGNNERRGARHSSERQDSNGSRSHDHRNQSPFRDLRDWPSSKSHDRCDISQFRGHDRSRERERGHEMGRRDTRSPPFYPRDRHFPRRGSSREREEFDRREHYFRSQRHLPLGGRRDHERRGLFEEIGHTRGFRDRRASPVRYSMERHKDGEIRRCNSGSKCPHEDAHHEGHSEAEGIAKNMKNISGNKLFDNLCSTFNDNPALQAALQAWKGKQTVEVGTIDVHSFEVFKPNPDKSRADKNNQFNHNKTPSKIPWHGVYDGVGEHRNIDHRSHDRDDVDKHMKHIREMSPHMHRSYRQDGREPYGYHESNRSGDHRTSYDRDRSPRHHESYHDRERHYSHHDTYNHDRNRGYRPNSPQRHCRPHSPEHLEMKDKNTSWWGKSSRFLDRI